MTIEGKQRRQAIVALGASRLLLTLPDKACSRAVAAIDQLKRLYRRYADEQPL